ncbi:hypothetical protein QUF58_04825 [Anaerolineales bacterium HSG24]|nr:hypothetical protein [Anaerolineales bacterium HSG24]
MRQLNIDKANSQLIELINAVLNGEDVVITDAGYPIIKLVLIDPGWQRRGAINTTQLDIIINNEQSDELENS